MKQTRKNKYFIMDDKSRNAFYLIPRNLNKNNKFLSAAYIKGAYNTSYFKSLLKSAARRKQFKVFSKKY